MKALRPLSACAHCQGPLAAGGAGEERFCCTGCAGAFRLINGLGLDSYYRQRTLAMKPETIDPVPLVDAVKMDERGVCTLDLAVDGLTCAACVWLIEQVLARCSGVERARINMTTRRLSLAWRGEAAMADDLAADVARLGYRLVPFAQGASLEDTTGRDLIRCLAVAGFAAANIMLLSVGVWAGAFQGIGNATRDLMHWVSAIIAIPAVAYAGRPFFRSAIGALRAGGTNMDVPISIGVLLAVGASVFETATSADHAYFDGATMLLFFLLIGRVLDHRARGQARSAVGRLLLMRTSAVQVLGAAGETTSRVPDRVLPGERILVATGERLGLDGVVEQGDALLDTSVLTGETLPRRLGLGEAVLAGMVNLGKPLTVRVTASGESTVLAEIVRLMETAEQGRGRFTALADRVARAYAPVVHLAALATFIGWTFLGSGGWHPALGYAISVLIITCPCALALAVPVVQVIAAGRLLKRGILLKSPTALERLAAVDSVAFDKTGTLTRGEPHLISAHDPTVLRQAASLALSSRHPLSKALVRAAGPAIAACDTVEVAGEGLASGTLRLGSRAFCGVVSDEHADASEVWLLDGQGQTHRFLFADVLRPDARATVADLLAEGTKVALLSGDRPGPVDSIADACGILDRRAQLSPAGKYAALEAMAASGGKVLMVGDGLNDGPALSAASVSMAPASAVDLAQIKADLVFQGDRLAAVPLAMNVARMAQKLARQNLLIALGYNCFALPLAIGGMVTPLIAALSMSASSLLVIANAFRLARTTEKD
ncbi:heavy metal translocating P-type ATPase metal-binding domain-containing protein [Lacibacterium aquatile]|uniref:Heavy metal translocating P-type ATPase metal-binding domain-containing protein n=1 Tax=Lacibacterium aquatile TaxID=1168082 RepID=A0ABW5DVL1_9PROT